MGEGSMDEEDDKEWKALGKAFFRRPPPVSPAETELFVRRVMARIPSPSPWTGRWLVPALGFSSAMFLLSLIPRKDPDDMDRALLSAWNSDAEWVSQAGGRVSEDLLGYSTEAK
jgi:hypothetical protein